MAKAAVLLTPRPEDENPTPSAAATMAAARSGFDDANHDECGININRVGHLAFGKGEQKENGNWTVPCARCARAHEEENPDDKPCWPYARAPFPHIRLGMLQVGERFWLVWDSAAGTGGITGAVIRQPKGGGYTQVRLDKETEEVVDFTDSEGRHFHFGARKGNVTNWSAGTLVVRLTGQEEEILEVLMDAKGTENAVSLKGGTKKSTAQAAAEAKAKAAAAKGGNGAAPAKAEAKEAKPKREKVEREPHDCGCGCGEQVKATFKPGHDSKFYSMLKKVHRNEMAFKDLPAIVRKEVKDAAGIKAKLEAHFPNAEW